MFSFFFGRNALQLNQGEVTDKLKDMEMANVQLKFELDVTSKQLMINSNDLASSKIELQQHRNEIDVGHQIAIVARFSQYNSLKNCLPILYSV